LRDLPRIAGHECSEDKEIERDMLPLLRRSIVAKKDLPKGAVLNLEDITWVRPSGGLKPGEESQVIGKTLKQPVKTHEFLVPELLEDSPQ